MKTLHSIILSIDTIINLIIGIVLLLYPLGIPVWLGLPESNNGFYPLILGAVIFGIGLALWIELRYGKKGWRGLGFQGAIAINLCGGGILLLWLLMSNAAIPFRGYIVLWIVALAVLLTGGAEIAISATRKNRLFK